jgi:gliding motility-associated-like protein
MNRKPLTQLLFSITAVLTSSFAFAQLQVSPANTAQELAQKLVGDGVLITNISFTGNLLMGGFFNNLGGTNINIDSGIVLTSGRAMTGRNGPLGVNGNGSATAASSLATTSWNLPGDPDLGLEIGSSGTHDACVLEFDFIPLGDSIRFNYVFSSEEYTPAYACPGPGGFNDAFAFFISGPGITGRKNIALVPNTTIPVSIFNVNNVVDGSNIPVCPNNPQYFVNNKSNVYFTHDGHTTVLTALEKVLPCQVYHLKLVISDVGDFQFDSGVFLEAKSLSSNAIGMANQTQTDNQGNSYLVEGCVSGSFVIRRPRKDPTPLSVALSYSGSAINGVDVQTLPSIVTIPANDSFVIVNVVPIIDVIPEGIEDVIIYALAGCAAGTPTDSLRIQIRDFDTLGITPRNEIICNNTALQLTASAGYATYQWDPDPSLSNTNIPDPIATVATSPTTYYCTAILGTCHARDSTTLWVKKILFISKTDVNCTNGNSGSISVGSGGLWIAPFEFSLDGVNWQADSSFNNLTVGNYWVKIRDVNCIDSIPVSVLQLFSSLAVNTTLITPAGCSGNPDGTITVAGSGGNSPYTFSLDGINYQAANVFNVKDGIYTVTIKDVNGCTSTTNAIVLLNNTVTVDATANISICEGTQYKIPAVSNATGFAWTPASSLDNASLLTPVATPPVTTWYYITATTGICSGTDSILITIRPAPIPDAGPDADICFGKTVQLNGQGGLQYQWSPSTFFTTPSNIRNPTVRPNNDITYYLSVTDINNCKSLVTDMVKITVTPAVKIFAGNDTLVAFNQPLQLQARELSNAGVTSYTWTAPDFLNNPNIANPVAIPPHDFRYIVTGTTLDGCEGADDILIKVYKGPDIYVPSAFTPNHDGRNDVLRPIAVGIREFRFFRIFNRWGNMIYSSKDPSQGWDGKIRGLEQSTGSYVWIAEAIDYKGNLISRKGVVTIVR